jgi:hypothetical protein
LGRANRVAGRDVLDARKQNETEKELIKKDVLPLNYTAFVNIKITYKMRQNCMLKLLLLMMMRLLMTLLMG